MPHILIAIDGTNSVDYTIRSGESARGRTHGSWVQEFYHQAQADRKAYWPGPTDLGGATGLDCAGIYAGAMEWLQRNLREYGVSLRSCVSIDIQLTLVGHSRGGHTVIELCNNLPIPVNFLGLYDAVDMTAALGDTSVIRNARFTAHARRSPFMDSWSWWGNTGTSASSGVYRERYFDTNHGGIGGDVGDAEAPLDSSCVYRPPAPEVTRCYRGECYEVPNSATPRYAGEMNPDVHRRCGVESIAAHSWIRQQATSRGVRFVH